MNDQLLPEFQKYLHSKSLVQEKYIPFYANWAREFLTYSINNENLTHELKVDKFLNHLKLREKISEWQIRQADDAIKLYVHQFLNSNERR